MFETQLGLFGSSGGVPLFNMHFASFVILHFAPLPVVRQQVTKPGLPQVEWAAAFFTGPLQVLGSELGSFGSRVERVLAMPAAHLTYCP